VTSSYIACSNRTKHGRKLTPSAPFLFVSRVAQALQECSACSR
jgi:hypothetical protein